MENPNSVPNRVFGLDLGDRHIQLCEVEGPSGKRVQERKIATTRAALVAFFSKIQPARIALEAGTHSPWISRCLQEMGQEVIVANPRRVRLISNNPTKDDQTDARLLAELARVSPQLLSPIQHRGRQAQADLAVVRAREALVRTRTRLIQHCRGAVKSWGLRLSASSPYAFASKISPQIPPELQDALDPVLEVIQSLNEQIRRSNRTLEHLSQQRYPETQLLRQIRGVGAVTALAFVLVLESWSRFERSRCVGAYLARPSHRTDHISLSPRFGRYPEALPGPGPLRQPV